MSKIYKQIYDRDFILVDPKKQTVKFACCSCGLCHQFILKIVGKKIEVYIRRDNRATAALRRKHGKDVHGT